MMAMLSRGCCDICLPSLEPSIYHTLLEDSQFINYACVLTNKLNDADKPPA